MGMQLESTPEMGEYEVEMRKESFYLSTPGSFYVYGGSSQCDFVTVEFNYEDIPKIRAALDLVEANPSG